MHCKAAGAQRVEKEGWSAEAGTAGVPWALAASCCVRSCREGAPPVGLWVWRAGGQPREMVRAQLRSQAAISSSQTLPSHTTRTHSSTQCPEQLQLPAKTPAPLGLCSAPRGCSTNTHLSPLPQIPAPWPCAVQSISPLSTAQEAAIASFASFDARCWRCQTVSSSRGTGESVLCSVSHTPPQGATCTWPPAARVHCCI